MEQVKKFYSTAPWFMSDARLSDQGTGDFRWQDSILVAAGDSNYYPETWDTGMTKIFFQDSIVFQNTWNRSYMSPANLLTIIYYGRTAEVQVLRIINESHYPGDPNGEYRRDNRIFIFSGNRLINLDPKKMQFLYYIWGIGIAPRPGTIIFGSGTFPRSWPQTHYYLVDLNSGEFRMFEE